MHTSPGPRALPPAPPPPCALVCHVHCPSPKRAKKHLIAADCGELKATFGPRLRCTAKQKVKH